MADLLESGQDWLAGKLKAHASREVLYLRGASQVPVSATIGRTLLKLDDGYGGIRMEWTDRDYLIQAVEIDFGSGPVTPQRGDRIQDTVGSIVSTYEVAAYGGEPPFRPSDPFGIVLRIHTKCIEQESV